MIAVTVAECAIFDRPLLVFIQGPIKIFGLLATNESQALLAALRGPRNGSETEAIQRVDGLRPHGLFARLVEPDKAMLSK